MIFMDLKSNTVVLKGGSRTILNELSSIVVLIIEKGNIKKETVRKMISDDKFWDSIECDEDEEE